MRHGMLSDSWKVCFNLDMLKKEAIELLGGSVTSAAIRIGIRPQAISGWPEVLTPALRDRVQAALYRRDIELANSDTTPHHPALAASDIEPAAAEQGV